MDKAGQTDRGTRDYRGVVAVLAGLLAALIGLIVVIVLSSGAGGPTALGSQVAAVPTASGLATLPATPGSSPIASGSAAVPTGTPLGAEPGHTLNPPDAPGPRIGFDAANPIIVSSLPFTYEADSRGAPAAHSDSAWNCDESEFGDHAVWFSYTAPADTFVGAWWGDSVAYRELWAFEYEASTGSLRYVDCSVGPLTPALRFHAAAGRTYLVRVTDYAHQGYGGRGGKFKIWFEVPPPIPDISGVIDPGGTALIDGLANFGGTISCSSPTSVSLDSVRLRQDEHVRGSEWVGRIRCRPGGTPFFVEIEPDDSGHPFLPGPATAAVDVRACVLDDVDDDRSYCTELTIERNVTLRAQDVPVSTPSPPVVSPSNAPPEPSVLPT